jgi:hypothetical protein
MFYPFTWVRCIALASIWALAAADPVVPAATVLHELNCVSTTTFVCILIRCPPA